MRAFPTSDKCMQVAFHLNSKLAHAEAQDVQIPLLTHTADRSCGVLGSWVVSSSSLGNQGSILAKSMLLDLQTEFGRPPTSWRSLVHAIISSFDSSIVVGLVSCCLKTCNQILLRWCPDDAEEDPQRIQRRVVVHANVAWNSLHGWHSMNQWWWCDNILRHGNEVACWRSHCRCDRWRLQRRWRWRHRQHARRDLRRWIDYWC